jgi:hypothetical protein
MAQAVSETAVEGIGLDLTLLVCRIAVWTEVHLFGFEVIEVAEFRLPMMIEDIVIT